MSRESPLVRGGIFRGFTNLTITLSTLQRLAISQKFSEQKPVILVFDFMPLSMCQERVACDIDKMSKVGSGKTNTHRLFEHSLRRRTLERLRQTSQGLGELFWQAAQVQQEPHIVHSSHSIDRYTTSPNLPFVDAFTLSPAHSAI